MKILITSGGTDVPIDDVRKISNMSSGKYGAQIAAEYLQRKQDILFFSQKNSAHPYNYLENINVFGVTDAELYHSYITFKDYYEYLNVVQHVEQYKPDIIISAAAVSDYILDKTQGKISSDGDELIIKLKKAPKVLPLLRQASPDAFLVGFKLLVSPSYKQAYDAVKKVFNSGADLVVYNDLTDLRKGDSSRLVFKKDMSCEKIDNVKQLIDLIDKNNIDKTKQEKGYGL